MEGVTPSTRSNLAQRYLENAGSDLAAWHGDCAELAARVVEAEGRGEFILITPLGHRRLRGNGPGRWSWHVAPQIDGCVHDAWGAHEPSPLPVYLGVAFPNQAVAVSVFEELEALYGFLRGRHALVKRRGGAENSPKK